MSDKTIETEDWFRHWRPADFVSTNPDVLAKPEYYTNKQTLEKLIRLLEQTTKGYAEAAQYELADTASDLLQSLRELYEIRYSVRSS